MLLLVLLLQLPSSPILAILSNRCTGSRYRNVLNTKLSPPRISSSSLFSNLHVTCSILSLFSLLDPLAHTHWSLFSNNQLTEISRSQTAPSGMPHLNYGTSFLLLIVFLISSILHHHPSLLDRHTLTLHHLLTFLVAFSTLVLKLSFSQSLSLHSRLSLRHWRREGGEGGHAPRVPLCRGGILRGENMEF